MRHACRLAHPQVSEIKPEWLIEIAPHYYSKKDILDMGAAKMPKATGKARAALDASAADVD
jgi:hypothetical protein